MVTEKVAFVIPTLNEEAALHRLLAEIPPNFAQWVIVVDNGSTLCYSRCSTTFGSNRCQRTATRLWMSLFEGLRNGVQPRCRDGYIYGRGRK